MDIFVFLPCYNEEENITDLIQTWNRQAKKLFEKEALKLTIIGIDDCSTDSTNLKIEEAAGNYPNVILIKHGVNKGLCGGLNTAISNFLKLGSHDSFMVLMDGDNTHDPSYIFDMIMEQKQGCDCVIASRYKKNSKTVGLALHREFLSNMARFYYKFMLKVPNVQDYTCGYRLYTHKCVERLTERFGPEPIKEKSFACMMELLYKLYLTGTSFGEASFELRYDRKKGSSKMRVLKTMCNSLVTALKLKFLTRE